MTASPSRDASPGPIFPPDPPGPFELHVVRRRDVRRLAAQGPPRGDLPERHGADKDPRYPSRRSLRRFCSFVIDLLVHLGCGIGPAVVLAERSPGLAVAAGLGGFLAASLLDRIAVQRIFRASVGKMIMGLAVVRDDTGGPPTVWSLVKEWFMGVVLTVGMLSS